MLSTTLTFREQVDIPVAISPLIKKRNKTHYQILLDSADKVIGDISIVDTVMTIQYSSELQK